MITSLKNDRVRLVLALQGRRRVRQRERRLVVEGVRLCAEAACAGTVPHLVFHTGEAESDPRAAALLAGWREAGTSCEQVSDEVMAACSGTETPQGLLAVVPLPELEPSPHPTLTLILDRLRDPGNLGAALRTALAAGVDQVLLTPGTVDATNPKVVRAAMGAHFHLPIAALRWEQIPGALSSARVYLSDAHGELDYVRVDWRAPSALIVGGEAAGADDRSTALADAAIAIPMAGAVESLNAAIAAAVILFEAARQRRTASITETVS